LGVSEYSWVAAEVFEVKSLTVSLSDEVYERAERRARERGVTLPNEVAAFVIQYGDGSPAPAVNGESAVGRLFAALDAGRNVVSVGILARDDLYDRPVLH
jgi:hypothetical protein